MDFHTSSLDRYEALEAKSYSERIDDRLDDLGHTITVTAYEKDESVRWIACCLTANEFHEAMHEVLRDELKYDLIRTDNRVVG